MAIGRGAGVRGGEKPRLKGVAGPVAMQPILK
jgi:hypothetical protein